MAQHGYFMPQEEPDIVNAVGKLQWFQDHHNAYDKDYGVGVPFMGNQALSIVDNQGPAYVKFFKDIAAGGVPGYKTRT